MGQIMSTTKDVVALARPLVTDLGYAPDDASDLAEWFLSSVWLAAHDAQVRAVGADEVEAAMNKHWMTGDLTGFLAALGIEIRDEGDA